MSQSFFLEVPEPPAVKALIASLGYADLECLEFEEWPERIWPDEVLHFARRGVSARGVEAGFAEHSLQVSIYPFSGADDCELAFRFIEAFSNNPDAPVDAANGERLAVSQLRGTFDAQWLAESNQAALNELVRHINDGQKTARLDIFRRALYMGPRVLKELESAGPPATLSERLTARLRSLEWMSDYQLAPVVETPSRLNVEPLLFAQWFSERAALFPSVAFIAVQETDEQHFFVPFEKLPEIAGERCRLADEEQWLVDAIPQAEWPALLQRARTHETSPLAGASKGPAGPGWWQFWK